MKAPSDLEEDIFFTLHSFPNVTVLLRSLSSFDNLKDAGRSILHRYKGTLYGEKAKSGGMAQRLYPGDLMQRPLATDLTSIPKIFHQSWINDTMPTKFEEWSNSCRGANSDWEWVLWTDEDNRKMVEKYAPWFLQTYEFLRTEIYRADAARNIYMHVFGGVYADLDTECILPYNSLFERLGASTITGDGPQRVVNSARTVKKRKAEPSKDSSMPITAERRAFVGRMGVDDHSPESIPNAWMASTPGHPFWLLPMESAEELAQLAGMQPERMTGPVALYDQTIVYQEQYDAGQGDGGAKLDERYGKSGWRHLYKSSSVKGLARAPQSLVILPHYEVYPFSWQRDGDMFKKFCISSEETFDATRCKALLALEHWGSHSITYWSHSWKGDGDGHWDEHLKAISKSSSIEVQSPDGRKAPEEKTNYEIQNNQRQGKEQKSDDAAVEANRKAEAAKKKQGKKGSDRSVGFSVMRRKKR